MFLLITVVAIINSTKQHGHRERNCTHGERKRQFLSKSTERAEASFVQVTKKKS